LQAQVNVEELMKAVYLEKPGDPLKVTERPEPKLLSGGAVVK
jgi:hypothetical protein